MNTQPFCKTSLNDWAEFWVLTCTVHLIICCYHVMYAFHSESTLHICLNVRELLARNWRYFWSLSHCNETQTFSHLVRKRTRNHLAKLTKWLNLHGAFDCMLLSCYVRISESIHTLYLPECQGTPCSKQARYLKFKWLQRDSNPQPLSS